MPPMLAGARADTGVPFWKVEMLPALEGVVGREAMMDAVLLLFMRPFDLGDAECEDKWWECSGEDDVDTCVVGDVVAVDTDVALL